MKTDPHLSDARPSLFLCAHFEKPQSNTINSLVQGLGCPLCGLVLAVNHLFFISFSGKQHSSSDNYYYFMLASNTSLRLLEGEFVIKFWWCLKKPRVRNAVELRYWGDCTLIRSLPFVSLCEHLLLSSLPLPTLLMFFQLGVQASRETNWTFTELGSDSQHDSLIVQLRLDAHPGPNLQVGSGEESSELGVLLSTL